MADQEGLAKTVEAIVVAQYPDVCNTPVGSGMAPVAYQIMSQLDKAAATATKVNFNGEPAFHEKSFLSMVVGNEAGVGGGLSSGVNLGFCKPSEWSVTVRTQSNGVVRHDDPFDMNGASPQASGNTTGKANYIKISQKASVDEDGNIVVEKEVVLEDSEGNILARKSTETYDAAGNQLSFDEMKIDIDAASRGINLSPSSETGLPADLTSNRIELPRFPESAPQPTPSPVELPPPLMDLPPVEPPSQIPPSPVEVPPAQPTNPPIVPETPEEQGWWDSASPWVHGGLDVVGLIPGLGEAADGINALIYLGEGKYGEAALAAAAMIPIAGWGATAGKVFKRFGGAMKRGGRAVRAIAAAAEALWKKGKQAYGAAKRGVIAGVDALKRGGRRAINAVKAGAGTVKRKVGAAIKGAKEGVQAKWKKIKEKLGFRVTKKFSKKDIDKVIESSKRPRNPHIKEGERAIAKKLGRAKKGGYKSAFDGIKATQENAEKLIGDIMENPSIVDELDNYIDVFNNAGQGIRIEKGTNKFVGLMELILRGKP